MIYSLNLERLKMSVMFYPHFKLSQYANVVQKYRI